MKNDQKASTNNVKQLTKSMMFIKEIEPNIDLMKAERFRGVLSLDEDDAGVLILCLNYQGEEDVSLSKESEHYRDSIKAYKRIASEMEECLERICESGEDEFTINLSFWNMDYLISAIELTLDVAKDDDWEIGFRIELEAIYDNLYEIYNQWKLAVSRKKTSVKSKRSFKIKGE